MLVHCKDETRQLLSLEIFTISVALSFMMLCLFSLSLHPHCVFLFVFQPSLVCTPWWVTSSTMKPWPVAPLSTSKASTVRTVKHTLCCTHVPKIYCMLLICLDLGKFARCLSCLELTQTQIFDVENKYRNSGLKYSRSLHGVWRKYHLTREKCWSWSCVGFESSEMISSWQNVGLFYQE